MEENKDLNQQPAEDNSAKEKKRNNGAAIIGYNILALVIYTLLFKLTGDSGALVLDAFVLFLHVVFCIGMSIGKRSGWWLLSSLLVLVIGFSTCAMIGFNFDVR